MKDKRDEVVASLTINGWEELSPEWRQEVLGWLRRKLSDLSERPKGERLSKRFVSCLYKYK